MSISVTCDGCGKSLKVKDEWAGKRGKCPTCGKTFPIPAAGAAMIAGAAPALAGRRAVPKATAKPQKKGGGVAISWGKIILILFVIAIPASIAIFYFGPVRTWHKWEEIGERADFDVKDVVTFAIQSYESEHGGYDPSKAHQTPTANEVMFVRPLGMSMPEKVQFKGGSSAGPFEGYYHPKTGEVEANIDIGGGVGLFGKEHHGTMIKVTGRMVDKHAQAEINGKKAEIHYRKHDEDI
jgi:hypothetical protein